MLRRLALTAFFLFVLMAASVVGARAQRGSGIFITPIPNVPFSATVQEERSFVQNNGSLLEMKTMRTIARDSQGRIHNEMRSMVPVSGTTAPKLISIHLYDPQTRVSTMIYPDQQLFRAVTVNRPPPTEPPELLYASPMGQNIPLNQFTKEVDLGTHKMDGLEVHGVRETQTIPAETSGTGKAVMITDEYWYSDYLHMNMVIRHNDPRSGSVDMTVIQVSPNDPDPALFAVPDGYKQVGMQQAVPRETAQGSGSQQTSSFLLSRSATPGESALSEVEEASSSIC